MLTVVGTGIRLGQLTAEAKEAIEKADIVFAGMANFPSKSYLESLNPNVRDLRLFYAEGKDRMVTYGEMVEAVVNAVEDHDRVCFAIYGHPCVFAYPTREALRRARLAGHKTRVLPGISAEDCLLAELELDPAESGCQSYEATYFLEWAPDWDPEAILILWQMEVLSERRYVKHRSLDGFEELVARLETTYGANHPAHVYICSSYPFADSQIDRISIGEMRKEHFSHMCTLVIPGRER